MIPLFKPFVSEKAIESVSNVLRSGYIAQGPTVDEFENQLRMELKSDYVVTVNSATSALFLAYNLIKDTLCTSQIEVLTTPVTCFATNATILHNNLKIKWVDIEEDTFNINLDFVRSRWSENTRILVVVHWGGYPIDLWKLQQLKDDYASMFGHELFVVHDCAHAFGSKFSYKTIPWACPNDFICYSFQAIKSLTCGDGGALVTPEWAYKRARLLRWFGLDRDNKEDFRHCQDIKLCGYKLHMNDISAAIGLSNLPYVKENISKQKKNSLYIAANVENSKIRGTKLSLWPFESSAWLHSLIVDDSSKFAKYMGERGIMANPVHTRNDHMTVFNNFRDDDNLPCVNKLESRRVCIPNGWFLGENDLETIVKACNDY